MARSCGLQENDLGGIDFVIKPRCNVSCSGHIDAGDESTSEAEAGSDILPARTDKERGEFHSLFGDDTSIDGVRFSQATKVTQPARHCPRNLMVHTTKTVRQTTPQLFRAGQIDPSVWARAFDSEPALIRVSCIVVITCDL